jgi:hypothetical protein
MKKVQFVPVLVAGLLSVPVFAQGLAVPAQRDVNQQVRIESGLKSGQLTTREAAKLEREEARIDSAEARALRDGKLSAAEKSRIGAMQDKASRDIYAQKHDAQTGNPNSASSLRMQADVQRNIHQEQRIAGGVKSGSLTHHEAARLESGQARIERKEFRAGRDGHVGAVEQARVQRTENRQSRHIRREKHDAQQRG